MGWPSSLGRATHLTHAIGARSTIDEVRDRLRIMGGLTKIRTPGAQTGRCARRRATITAYPVGWDRRPTRSQRDFVDRSRSAQCAQPGRVRAKMRSSGSSDHRRNCHPRIKRQLPAITCGTHRVPHGVLLELVTDGAQQVAPVGHVAIGLHPEGRLSVDDGLNPHTRTIRALLAAIAELEDRDRHTRRRLMPKARLHAGHFKCSAAAGTEFAKNIQVRVRPAALRACAARHWH